MAITGSGSLAISLSVFVISAAFLPKGESPPFFPPSLCVSRTGAWLLLFFFFFCGVAPFAAEAGKRRRRRKGEKLRWRLRAGMRASCAGIQQHHFLPLWTLGDVVAVFKAASPPTRVVVLSGGVGDSGGGEEGTKK